MNKISLQIIKELTTYNDADFKVLQGRLSLGMYGSDVSQEVAQHVADDSQRRKLNDADATLPKVSPTWEVDLEVERARSLDLWCGSHKEQHKMTTYTKHEQRIFNKIARESMNGNALDITDFWSDELTTKQIRGVISSLVKKNKIWVDDEKVGGSLFIWPNHSKYGCQFWCDVVSEGEEEYITDSEVNA